MLTKTHTPMLGLAPLWWLVCFKFYEHACHQIHRSHADLGHVNAQRLKYRDLLDGVTWRRYPMR